MCVSLGGQYIQQEACHILGLLRAKVVIHSLQTCMHTCVSYEEEDTCDSFPADVMHTYAHRPRCVCVCTHACVRKSARAYAVKQVCYPLYVCVHTHIHTYTHTRTHIYTHTREIIELLSYPLVCVYVCMCVCARARESPDAWASICCGAASGTRARTRVRELAY
jgi:hypothetical protein